MGREAEASIKYGASFYVRVESIKPGVDLGFDTQQPLAVTTRIPEVDGTNEQGIYPLPENYSLRQGDIAYILAVTKTYPD